MKHNFLKLILCAACVCVGSRSAPATPLYRAEVMADPAWLLHLDCDALRPTAVGKYILAEMDKPEAKAKLAAFQTIFGLDLRTQLHGVTLYGSSSSPADGVLIVQADFDPERLLTLARAAKDFKSNTRNKHEIYSWIDDKKPAKDGVQPRVYAAIQGERVIFGQREDPVAAALDVLDGTTPSLAAGKTFPDLGGSVNGNIVEAAARKFNLPNADPGATILKLSKSAQAVLAVNQQQCQGTLTLVADNEEVAGNINSIAQGLVALMKLQTNKPEAVKLANAIVIRQDGAKIMGNVKLPVGEVVEMMKADAARKAAALEKKDAKE